MLFSVERIPKYALHSLLKPHEPLGNLEKFESVFPLDLFYMIDFLSICKCQINENWLFLALT